MGEIVNDLLLSLQSHLEDKLQRNIPQEFLNVLRYTGSDGEQHVLKPSLIKIGRLQDDPTVLSEDAAEPSVFIGLHTNDPGNPESWRHIVGGSAGQYNENLMLQIVRPYEIGGGEAWWRRLMVDIQIYFIDSDQDQQEATRLANALRGALEKCCSSRTLSNPHGWDCALTDDFGEFAESSHVVSSYMEEGGGPEDDYIWRGRIWLQVRTWRE